MAKEDKSTERKERVESREESLLRLFAQDLLAVRASDWPSAQSIEERQDVLSNATELLPHFIRLQPYIERSGWLRSVREQRIIDRAGNPLPWITYPAIHFLADRVKSDFEVFEFGSGYSTLWWASRVKSVTSVEHSIRWTRLLQPMLPENVSHHRVNLDENGDYCRTARRLGGPYDVIFIDGRDRVNCCINSVEQLTERGVVVWDNSERPRYRPGRDFLAERGFKHIDFRGHGPINGGQWQTTVFYRPGNCLDI